VANKSISTFVETIAKHGGMSYSNNYDIEFMFKSDSIIQRFNSFGITTSSSQTLTTTTPSNPGSIVKLFCDEAQLPNIQAATGQMTGMLLGEGMVNYPHTRMYSDFQLSWMCDANMTPLKFLEVWYSWIFQELDTKGGQIVSSGKYQKKKTLEEIKGGAGAGGGNAIERYKSVRLNYPSTYLSNIIITKTERSKNAPNGRAPISYTMIDAFPYSIDAVPLSYGASQVTKVSANFYYAKHFVTHNNIRDFNG
jgi:hypothetical protein